MIQWPILLSHLTSNSGTQINTKDGKNTITSPFLIHWFHVFLPLESYMDEKKKEMKENYIISRWGKC